MLVQCKEPLELFQPRPGPYDGSALAIADRLSTLPHACSSNTYHATLALLNLAFLQA